MESFLRESRGRAAFVLVLTIAFVALVTVLAKQSLATINYFSFVWLQMLIASLLMLAYTFGIRRESLGKVPVNVWMTIIGIGLLNFAIVRTVFIYALELLPATTHAYVINFVGITTMFLSAMILREPPTRWQIIGALVALSGVRIYFWHSLAASELVGVAWLVIAIFCLAMTNILMRRLHAINHNALTNNQIASLSITIGAIPLVVWGSLTDNYLATISVNGWFVISLNAIFSICLVMIIFNLALKILKAYEASILATSGVVFTSIFSALILHENIQSNQFFGIGLMISGIIMVQYLSHQKVKPA